MAGGDDEAQPLPEMRALRNLGSEAALKMRELGNQGSEAAPKILWDEIKQ
jgi:hypothetical protein